MITNDKPSKIAWIKNKIGDKNKNENSSGSVIPVKNEVKAPDANKPATSFFLSGRAAWYIASAAAGKPNIIIGNSPPMKLPAVSWTLSFNCAKKIVISPRTTEPAAVVYEPNSYQNGAWKIWCNPNGISKRLINPKKNTAIYVPSSSNQRDAVFMPACTGGQIISNNNPAMKAAAAVAIGTKRFPAKKPRNEGISISWNLL